MRTRLAVIALCASILGGAPWAAGPVPTQAPPARPQLVQQPSSQPQPSNGLAVWPQGAGSPTFELADTSGIPRTLRDYHGHIVVVFFGFLHCPDACPAGLLKLALVMKQLGPVAARVQVLFITLDPERDTPASLKTYVSAFSPRFIGLTGTSAQIGKAAADFNVQYARVPVGDDYTIDHSTGIFVFDGEGDLRLIGATHLPVDNFVRDITALATERPGSSR